GGIAIAQERFETVGGQDLGGSQGELAAEKARVVAQDESLRGRCGNGFQVIADGLGGEANVVEGEIAGNEAAPAARAKFNHLALPIERAFLEGIDVTNDE